MSSSQRSYSSLGVEESLSSNPFTAVEFPFETSRYFDAWLKEIEPALQSNETSLPETTQAKQPPSLDEFRFEGTLRVDCFVAGRIRSSTGTLIIAETGKADADISVAVAIIEGQVSGKIHALERVELGNGSKVIGDIETAAISIQPGAVFEGRCIFLSNQAPTDIDVRRLSSGDSSIPQRPQNLRDKDEQREESFFVAVGR